MASNEYPESAIRQGGNEYAAMKDVYAGPAQMGIFDEEPPCGSDDGIDIPMEVTYAGPAVVSPSIAPNPDSIDPSSMMAVYAGPEYFSGRREKLMVLAPDADQDPGSDEPPTTHFSAQVSAHHAQFFCPTCGAKRIAEARFCSECGAEFPAE